jgi:hypothetical protein
MTGPPIIPPAEADYGTTPPAENNIVIIREKEQTERRKIDIFYEVFLKLREFFVLITFLLYAVLILHLLDYNIEKTKEFVLLVLPVVTLILGIEKNREK